jgi:hypothetical protein
VLIALGDIVMIRANVGEQFPITVSLTDELNGGMGTGKTVYYDFREQPSDTPLTPTMSGTLPESSVEPGVYTKMFSIDTVGDYIVYTASAEFMSGAEDVLITADEHEELADLIRQNRNYNLSVEDVIRENAVANASQTARKVALGNTDYIVNVIKPDSDSDWSGSTVSGITYAWYKDESDDVPYKMAGDGV